MTRFPFDQFAKDYFKELLQPVGDVKTDKKVPAEIREIDIYFVPSPQSSDDELKLGLLRQFAETTPAIFEPFRDAVKRKEIRASMNKLFDTFADIEREYKRQKTRVREENLPSLWILSPTASEQILNGFKAEADETKWGKGVYLLGSDLKTAIIVIHQLPDTPETLWLRILGKGSVQKKAVAELQALSEDNPLRNNVIDLLLSLKTTLEVKKKRAKQDDDLIMNLSPIYLQKLAEVKQEGQQEGRVEGSINERRTVIENLLRLRFGSLDPELTAIIEPLSALSPEEYSPLLLQSDREDLLNRFSQ